MRRSIPRKVALAVLIALAAVTIASAQAVASTSFAVRIDKTAKLATGGKGLVATGRVSCPSGDLVRMLAIVVQRTTGALAQGVFPGAGGRVTCSGGDDHWTMSLNVNPPSSSKKSSNRKTFKKGSAELCTLAVSAARKVGFTGIVKACQAVNVVAAK